MGYNVFDMDFEGDYPWSEKEAIANVVQQVEQDVQQAEGARRAAAAAAVAGRSF